MYLSSFQSLRSACLRRKPLQPPAESQLQRTLTAVDLILYGVGASVGAGIYCLVGIGADLAGPAISISFLICGLACILTSFCYSEFASRIPVTGSAYVYAYVTFGEIWGWLVGWNLTLGYGVSASVVARSWAEYVAAWLRSLAQRLGWNDAALEYLTNFPIFKDYTCSPLSMVIIAILTIILTSGVKESLKFNNFTTCLNLAFLVMVITVGSTTIEVDNFIPFFPNELSGVAAGAGLVFFSFIGFDMVACLSEEVVDPARNMPIGIVGSLVISSLIYVALSLTVVGMAPTELLGESSPVTNALLANACCTHEQMIDSSSAENVCLHHACSPVHRPLLLLCSRIIGVGAIFALTSATFVCLMGQPRIFYSMAKDGLLFPAFGKINPRTHVPTTATIVTGVMAALLACFVELQVLANVISVGTLLVFTFVDAAVIILRMRPWHEQIPLSERSFVLRTPPISRANLEAMDKPTIPLSLKKSVRENGSRPIIYVSLFAICCLLVAFGIRDEWNMLLIWTFAALAVLFAVLLGFMARSKPPETFQCPLVPWLPLCGMAANLLMAGAIPGYTWLLTLLWMLVGAIFYICYGIHHSTLREQDDSAMGERRNLRRGSSSEHYNAIPSAATLIPPGEFIQ